MTKLKLKKRFSEFNFQEQLDNNKSTIIEVEHLNIPGAEQVKIEFKNSDYVISCVRGGTGLYAGFLHDSEGWEVWDFEGVMCDPISMSVDDINDFVNQQMKSMKLILK